MVTVSLLAILLQVSSGQNPHPVKPANGQQEQAAQVNERTNSPTSAGLQPSAKQSNPETDKGNKAERELVTATWWLVVVTGLLVIIGSVASILAWCTLSDLKSQTRHARISSIAGRKSAKAALLNAQTVLNSERAWIMSEFDWIPGMAILYEVHTVTSGQRREYISGSFRLTCTNDGKTPGWITGVVAKLQVVGALPDPPEMGNWGFVDPVERALPATRKPSHWDMGLSYEFPNGEAPDPPMKIVWGVIEYRDIFDRIRRTFFGYSIGPDNKKLTRLISRAYNRNE